jgi:hypothetical protein
LNPPEVWKIDVFKGISVQENKTSQKQGYYITVTFKNKNYYFE